MNAPENSSATKSILSKLSISLLVAVAFTLTEWPESLKNFIQNCVKFSLPREINGSIEGLSITSPTNISEIDPEIRRGMTGKKLHEVCHMTSLIDHVTKKTGNDGVIDVGSGLGYLCQVLHCNYGHSVLGLEGKHGHTSGADKRTHKFERCHHLHNVTCELSQQTQSQQEFLSLILDWFSEIKSESTKCCHFKTALKTVKSHEKNIQTDSSELHSYDRSGSELSEKVENNSGNQSALARFSSTGSQSNFENNPIENTKNKNCNINLHAAVKNYDKGIKDNAFEVCKRKNNFVCDSERDCCLPDTVVGSDKVNNVPTFCMVGLHCCGDLTPIMLNNFVELDQITSLCCVSCCYHRMNFNEDIQTHDNFPMSQQLKTALVKTQQTYPEFKFSSYALRLAAQETRARWHEQTDEEHDFHMRNVAYRGILETSLLQPDTDETFQLKKNVRKLAHKADYQSFTAYIDAVSKHVHTPDTVSLEEFKLKFCQRMHQKLDKYQKYFCLIEPLTALQYLLQPVLESLIYMDRKQWLCEQGLQADIIPVFDELISPRNLALVAWK
ncbi:probable methyltransferase-like protein 25 [Ruditapes philippinarum]|uniref:probable methyltransferase-like protein 25 n=1 Tax=Ruditapes philippinarum TaxID=129788 RepID=UPI00295AAD2E|nr:probable methyltransferase-like protein 25 [Ruditapes philippinarum]